MYGYPALDIKATLVDAVQSETVSTAFAFEAVGAFAFDAACRKADPVLLQPVMTVDIMAPKEFVGEAMNSITARGGIISSLESKPAIEHIRAESPLVNMFGYATALRSMTQGRATFSMEFSHFEKKEGGL